MKEEIIELKKSNVINSYNEARKAGATGYMKFLENLFGEEIFKPKDITERVKTFEDAYCELGNDHPFVISYEKYVNTAGGEEPDVIAYLKLRIICAALNEGWEPQFREDEWHYYPWFWLYTQDEIDNMDEEDKKECSLMSIYGYQTGSYAGFVDSRSGYVPSDSHASVGSRLCLKSKELAIYCGKQFIHIWADYLLIRK